MAKFIDLDGLAYTYGKIKALISSSVAGKAEKTHTHAAGDITSGTLPVARGGTGNSSVDTTPTSGSTKMVTSGGVYTALSGKAASSHSHSAATTSAAGFMSATDKSKLDGIASGANAYTHPTTSGNKHIPSGGSSGQILRWSADGTAAWGADNNTTYSAATQSAQGLMSAADKSKLDGIATGANAYSHPNSGVTAGTYRSVTVNAAGHVTGGTNPTTLAGYGITDAANSSHTHDDYMTKDAPTGTGALSINRKADTTVGTRSVALGTNGTASGANSFACGATVTASGSGSVAHGLGATASGVYSFAHGNKSTASGDRSFAMGNQATASGVGSFAFGSYVTATADCAFACGNGANAGGVYSSAFGYETDALDYQHAQGHYNNTTNATAGVEEGTGTGTAFVIGNGTSSAGSNAFRVTYDGKPYAKSSFTTTGCDYAEFFEWLDGNPEAEDRRGYFVTLDGDKIKKAEPGDYILGIISGQPSVIGNGDEDWMGRYIMDDFGAFIYETFEYEQDVIDQETGEVTDTIKKTGTKYKENPDYDPSKGYIQREDRPEWSAVGMLGVLSVWDDGTCEVNGYCKVAEGGTATKAETGYRVIKRVNDNLVKVIFR